MMLRLNLNSLFAFCSRLLDFAFVSLALCMIASIFTDFGSSLLSSAFSDVSVCRGAMLGMKALR